MLSKVYTIQRILHAEIPVKRCSHEICHATAADNRNVIVNKTTYKECKKELHIDGGLLTLGQIWKHPMSNMQMYTNLTNG